MTKKYILEFDMPDDWEPLTDACWVGCPFSVLTHLSCVCRAKSAYDKYNIVICPVITRKGKYNG